MRDRVDIQVEHLAEYIFKTNAVDKKHIFLDVRSLNTSKELFYLFFDLFCKGLMILYGGSDKLLCLNNVSLEQFETVKSLLWYAHIGLFIAIHELKDAVMLDIIDEGETCERRVIQKSLATLRRMPNDSPIEDYKFSIMMNDIVMQIHFDVLID
jgi:hypothetical protein